MIGDRLIPWFVKFSGIVVYRITENGPDDNEGWININEYVKLFELTNQKFNGKPYNPSDKKQKEKLINAVINHMGIFCQFKLFERKRGIDPPRLEYRITKFGRRVDGWRFRNNFGIFKQRVLFSGIKLFLRLKKYWIIVTIVGVCLTAVSIVRFASLAFTRFPIYSFIFIWIFVIFIMIYLVSKKE